MEFIKNCRNKIYYEQLTEERAAEDITKKIIELDKDCMMTVHLTSLWEILTQKTNLYDL